MMKRAAVLAFLLAAAAAVAVAVAPSVAWADDPPPPADAQPVSPKVKVERTASGQKIFRITEGIVVEGKIQKPNAFYVLQRSSMDYDWESLKQDFLPKILQATGKHPF
jgi:hypothetical protein